uniref:BTB/POZ domain-containing protein KCTD12-like n=1 Tax=Myxine glutinosa TaxID=7769 RepID=UPI00358DFC5B
MAMPASGSSQRPAQANGGDLLLPEVVELNVGGQIYVTRLATLTSAPDSRLWRLFGGRGGGSDGGEDYELARDGRGRFFIDRDGFLFRYVLDYLRDHQLVLPEHFPELSRLRREADYFQLAGLAKLLTAKATTVTPNSGQQQPQLQHHVARRVRHPKPGYLTLACRGSYSLSRDGGAEARLRRAARIAVCGRAGLARDVFGDGLSERRESEPDHYSSRLWLSLSCPEQAFDRLAEAGFVLAACSGGGLTAHGASQNEEKVWGSYTEYVFYRGPPWPQAFGSGLCNPGEDGEDEEKDSETASSEEGSTSSCDSQSEGLVSPPPTGKCSPQPGLPPGRPEVLTLQRPGRREVGRDMKATPAVTSKKRRNSDRPETMTEALGEDGIGIGASEKDTLVDQLQKCVDDVSRLHIPKRFGIKTRPWQAELLDKYRV